MLSDSQILFTIGSLPVTSYAVSLVLSLCLGLALFALLCRREKLSEDTAGTFALLALPLGLLGARLFYCLARLDLYNEIGLGHILRLWDGGYALWGAVGGCALAAWLCARCTRQSAVQVMDAAAPAAALTIALARFSEYFSGEGIGMYIENPSLCFFPLAVSNEYGEWYWAIFVAEALVALGIMLVLLRKKNRPAGDNTRLFLLLYSAAQVLLESLRRDNYPRWLFVRVSQLTAVLVLAGMMLCAVVRWVRGKEKLPVRRFLMSFMVFLLCTGVCIALEFAVDKSPLPNWAAYSLMGCACVGLGVSAYQIVLKKE